MVAKFLFIMLAANDLGLPTHTVPIARKLADRGLDGLRRWSERG
jgi:hypothetical protein